jgi:tetratricopeptide (TPR) repeat protein
MKYYYNKMVMQGCSEDDPLVMEIKSRYEEITTKINAEKLAVFYAENPGNHAKALYDEGKYNEALDKYEEAIKKEESKGDEADQQVIGGYYFAQASILGRKLNRYSAARDYALKAAKMRPNWGQPYMLIGDLYAETSSSCGNEAWDHNIAVLAAIEKYAYARSIDSNVAEEASEKISRYSRFKPLSEEGFMRGVKEGSTVKVNCWIGETVRVSYQN